MSGVKYDCQSNKQEAKGLTGQETLHTGNYSVQTPRQEKKKHSNRDKLSQFQRCIEFGLLL